MTEKTDWQALDHNDKLRILRDYSVDNIVTDYKYGDEDASSFRTRLARENVLWQPKQYVSAPKMAGEPPNKEVVIGAWRDLDRSEALLELIDNSIDAWKRRQGKYPDKRSPRGPRSARLRCDSRRPGRTALLRLSWSSLAGRAGVVLPYLARRPA
jgi:hypothetical protein